MMRAVLGIDLGTSSVKVVAVDPDGRIVAAAQVGYSVARPHIDWAEQNPDIWWDATRDAVRAVLASLALEVVAVGVGGQMHGLVALDLDGNPVRSAIIWADARSGDQVRLWAERLGDARVELLTGMPIATGMLGISLTWVRDHEPAVYRRIAHVLSPKDYLRFRLTGVMATDPTDAAGGLLYDIRRGAPSSEIADAVGLDGELLAPVGATLAVAGQVTRAASASIGLPLGVPVAFGGGDQAMGALALGLQDAGRAAVAISSGGTVFKRTEVPLDVEYGLHVMPYVRRGQWLAMGVVLSAGLSIDWLVSEIFGAERSPERISALMDRAAEVPVGAEGLLAVPHLGGTRTPRVDASARAAFAGLGYAHGQAHLVRALVEGVCIALSSSLERMSAAGDPAREVVVSGGGARFALWRSTLADVTGLPVSVSSDVEHSAIGAALAAAGAADLDIRFDAAARIASTVEPDAAAHDAYREVAERLGRWEQAMTPPEIHRN